MNKKGFTLVELIACIAIIAVIATITIISFNKKDNAKVNNIENKIKDASIVYLDANIELNKKIEENEGYHFKHWNERQFFLEG